MKTSNRVPLCSKFCSNPTFATKHTCRPFRSLTRLLVWQILLKTSGLYDFSFRTPYEVSFGETLYKYDNVLADTTPIILV